MRAEELPWLRAVAPFPLGVVPATGWDGLARRAFLAARGLVAQARREDRPLRTVKNAAYAWRQMLFFASMADDAAAFAAWVTEPGPHPVLSSPVDGLLHVLRGGTLDPGARFLGWSSGRHPVLAAFPP